MAEKVKYAKMGEDLKAKCYSIPFLPRAPANQPCADTPAERMGAQATGNLVQKSKYPGDVGAMFLPWLPTQTSKDEDFWS